MNILINYDFTQNQILNVVAQNLATAPANPKEGQFYYNSALKRMFVWNGTKWEGCDALDAMLTGAQIVTAINASASIIDDNNLSTAVNSAITNTHSHSNKAILDGTEQSFTSALKTKLDGIATNANNYTHPTTDGSHHVPATGTTNNGKVLKSGSTAGSEAWGVVDWSELSNKPTSTVANIDGAVTDRHTHSNKATLDTYNQTNANLTDAVTKKHSQNTDTGTTSPTFHIDSDATGPKLKNSSGGLQVRNSADSAFADLEVNNQTVNGNLTVKGNITLGDGGTDATTITNEKVTIKTTGLKGEVGADTKTVFEIIDSTPTTPNKLFEVMQNGDTVIAGVLTVNGTGESTFAGDVSIGGALNVAQGTTAQADLAGTDLTLTGNLNVAGNTILGDNASQDTTTVKGVMTVTSKTTKALGSSTADAFKVVDSVGTGLFQVKENGDTVIGGVLTVNGTGTSTFAGSVSIGGALTVENGAVVTANLQGDNLTLTGNLVVNGNTTLGNEASDTLNVVGVVTLPTTTTIGTVAYSDLTNAKSKAHTQNTDTGTSSATFQVGSSGVKIKNSGGTELQVRNAADSDYANLRVKDLVVTGTTTTINSNTVNIGDSEIELNSDITTSAQNSDGGITIKRLKADNTTRADATLRFNNSTGRWETDMGPVAGVVTRSIANKIEFQVGNGVATSFNLTHNFNSRAVLVSVIETASPYGMCIADVACTDLNTVAVSFAVAPTTNQYTVVIIG